MYKKAFLAILMLAGIAFSLDVQIPTQVVSISGDEVASFLVILSSARNESVTVSVQSALPASVSEAAFDLVAGEQKQIYVFASAANMPSDLYLIQLFINGAEYGLAVNVLNSNPLLDFDAVYDQIFLFQGQAAELRFVLQNQASGELRNIIIRSNIPDSFLPKYPGIINLRQAESFDLNISIKIPGDQAVGTYTFTVTAVFGNAEFSQTVDVIVQSHLTIAEGVSFNSPLIVEAYKEDGRTVGYLVSFIIQNKAPANASLQLFFPNIPATWDVKGETKFVLPAFTTENRSLIVIPDNFNSFNMSVLLASGFQELNKTDVQLSGDRVGMLTGYALAGGSVAIGLLFLAIVVLVLLYVRQKNRHADELEQTKTKTYLEKLVEKAKREIKKEEPEE